MTGIAIITPIPVIYATNQDRDFFQMNYYQPQKPVVLSGFRKLYPAYEKWTMDFLRKKIGNIEAGLFGNHKEELSKTCRCPIPPFGLTNILILLNVSQLNGAFFCFRFLN